MVERSDSRASSIAYLSYADSALSKITWSTKLPISFYLALDVTSNLRRSGHGIFVNKVPLPTPLRSPQPPIILADGGHFTLLPLVGPSSAW